MSRTVLVHYSREGCCSKCSGGAQCLVGGVAESLVLVHKLGTGTIQGLILLHHTVFEGCFISSSNPVAEEDVLRNCV